MNTPNEQHIMELSAISTAAMQNTKLSVRDRIKKGNRYWTVAYQDVCNAVDREIRHRERESCLALELEKIAHHDGLDVCAIKKIARRALAMHPK